MNITAPIRRLARIMPDAIAIIGGDDRKLTYAALDLAIDRMAQRGAQLGLRAGDLVGLPIAPPDEVTALVLALGLARIGVGSGEPALPAKSVRLCFQAADPVPPERVRFDASWLTGPEPGAAPMHHDPGAVCRVFASSGTTGVARHVPVSHALMAQRVFGRWLGHPGSHDVHMATMGLGGSWGFTVVLRTLWTGGTLVIPNSQDPTAALGRHRVTTLSASPVALHALLELLPAGAGPFPALHTLELSGSMVPAPLYQRATERLCAHVVSHFGSSEAGGIASGPLPVLQQQRGAVGVIWPDLEVQAVDAAGTPLAPGEEGALRARGPGVAAGYIGNDAETAARFRDGWFLSSDIGAVWPDGTVTLSGRASDLINTGGSKVSPQLIEDALLKLPRVVDAAAFGVPDESGLEQIWAAIVAREPIDDAVLDAWCDRAPRAWAPQVILQVQALPRNANGKLQRDRLVELAQQLQEKR